MRFSALSVRISSRAGESKGQMLTDPFDEGLAVVEVAPWGDGAELNLARACFLAVVAESVILAVLACGFFGLGIGVTIALCGLAAVGSLFAFAAALAIIEDRRHLRALKEWAAAAARQRSVAQGE